MTINRDKVECAEDGEGYESYVCRHLLENPAQVWHSRDATPDNPCPDAWCAKCDKVFMRDGEWTDENSSCTQIQLICNFCYARRRAREIKDEA
jgi:hypothetical protein